MPTTSAPFGFRPTRPVNGGDGAELPLEMLQDGIATGYASTIGTGCPIKLDTAGVVQLMAATDAAFYGVFSGCFFVDSDGRERTSAKWTASATATNIRAFFWRNPFIEYFIQANGVVAQTKLGDEGDHVAGTVNALSGRSTDMFDTASIVGAGNSACFRVTGVADLPDNAWSDTYTILRVSPNELKGSAPMSGANAV